MNDPMQLPNVSVPPKFFDNRNIAPADIAATTYEYRITELRDLLWELATSRPTWQFKVSRGQMVIAQPPIMRIVELCIEEDGVILGKISADHYGVGYRLYVANDRMAKQRSSRNSGKMVTSDVKRAKREVLKNFFKKNPKEVAEEAFDHVHQAVRELSHQSYMRIREATNAFSRISVEFVEKNFEWVTTHPDAALLLENIATKERATSEQKLVESFGELANNVKSEGYDKAAVVCSLGSTYIVTYKGATEIIPSEDLAPELRTNMGMLKLMPVGEAYGGIGLRATDDVYLVLPTVSENEDAN